MKPIPANETPMKNSTIFDSFIIGAPIRICAELSRLQGGYIATYVLEAGLITFTFCISHSSNMPTITFVLTFICCCLRMTVWTYQR